MRDKLVRIANGLPYASTKPKTKGKRLVSVANPTKRVTASSLTPAQIRAFRDEAGSAGDTEAYRVASRALTCKTPTAESRKKVAKWINAGSAMANPRRGRLANCGACDGRPNRPGPTHSAMLDSYELAREAGDTYAASTLRAAMSGDREAMATVTEWYHAMLDEDRRRSSVSDYDLDAAVGVLTPPGHDDLYDGGYDDGDFDYAGPYYEDGDE